MNKISLFAIALLVVATATLTGCVKKTPVESPQTNGGDVIQNNTEDDGVSITESEDGKWKTYRNEKIGFEFRVPAKAKFNCLDDYLSVGVSNNDYCDGHPMAATIGMATISYNENKNIDRFEKRMFGGVESLYHKYDYEPRSDTGQVAPERPIYTSIEINIPMSYEVLYKPNQYSESELQIRYQRLKTYINKQMTEDEINLYKDLDEYYYEIINSLRIFK